MSISESVLWQDSLKYNKMHYHIDYHKDIFLQSYENLSEMNEFIIHNQFIHLARIYF